MQIVHAMIITYKLTAISFNWYPYPPQPQQQQRQQQQKQDVLKTVVSERYEVMSVFSRVAGVYEVLLLVRCLAFLVFVGGVFRCR